MKKFFAFMVILCMVFTVSVYAMEPTGPPGALFDNVVFGIPQPVQAAGVAMNLPVLFPDREQVNPLMYLQSCWAIPAMLAGLMCGAMATTIFDSYRQAILLEAEKVPTAAFKLFA